MPNYYENLKIDDLKSIVTKYYFLVESNYPFSFRQLHYVLYNVSQNCHYHNSRNYVVLFRASVSFYLKKCGIREPGYKIERFLSEIYRMSIFLSN